MPGATYELPQTQKLERVCIHDLHVYLSLFQAQTQLSKLKAAITTTQQTKILKQLYLTVLLSSKRHCTTWLVGALIINTTLQGDSNYSSTIMW